MRIKIIAKGSKLQWIVAVLSTIGYWFIEIMQQYNYFTL
jgi:hypothetical protein